MPVLAKGFAAVAERLKAQRAAVGAINARLHEINTALDQIMSKHELETSVRALEARKRHQTLRKRCVALAAKVQVLRNRGFSLGGEEDELKMKLEALGRQMDDPALGARTEELWSRLIVLREYSDRLKGELARRGPGGAEEGLGEEVEAKAKKVSDIDYVAGSLIRVDRELTMCLRFLKTTRSNFNTLRKRSRL